jgi:predicted GIY-YIG superfamily endonuclease
MMQKGRTVKIFLVDGSHTGLLTAEIMNWTGHVITGPRSRLAELIQRPEVQRSAVYFLLGPDPETDLGLQVYIGETEDVARRLTQHNRPEEKGGKDFWEQVCVVTSKDANLTKGHIKYLESRLIALTRQAKRCDLLNGTEPEYKGLPEADNSDMEFFLEQIQILLSVLGFDFLRTRQKRSSAQVGLGDADLVQSVSPIFSGDVRLYRIKARGQQINGEFVVFKGSTARLTWTGDESAAYRRLFNDLVKRGVLCPTADGQLNVFSQDYAFNSPSAAAAVVAGRSANGRAHWVVEGTQKTYGEWQTEVVSEVSESRLGAEDGETAA